MNREEFKLMNDNERIEWVLSKYTEGYKTKDIVKEYNIPKNTIGDTMRRNGYISDRTKGIYEVLESSYKPVIAGHQQETVKNMLEAPTQQEEILKNMFKWYQKQKEKEEEREEVYQWIRKQMELDNNIIDVPKIEINKNRLTGEIKTRSFTIYSDILEEFNEFCANKPYSKQDLLSMCIVEYMKKYK